MIVSVALYFIGIGMKNAQTIKDKYIPLILGVIGILLCGIWVVATSSIVSQQDIAMAIFTSTIQGILVAGLSVYVNQLYTQAKREE